MVPRKSAARRPGRPAESRGDQRERLLDATAALIGRNGVSGTTLVAVARRARVTPALVHYYFGSKSRLVDALFSERIAPAMQRIGAAIAAGDAIARLPQIVEGCIQTLSAAPWLPPILAREVLSEGGALRARFIEHARPVIGRVPPMIAAAQHGGVLRRDLDPRLVLLSVLSAVVYPILAAPIWREVLGVDERAISAAQLARHIATVLARGLENADA